jgi:hypothetical protein
MFFLALFFDIIGLIPVLNILTEIIATAIFGFWQTQYSPKSDPLLTIAATKLADIVFLGALPSNIGIVLISYGKKKATAKISGSAKISRQPTADMA